MTGILAARPPSARTGHHAAPGPPRRPDWNPGARVVAVQEV
ncbi:hypothetical protein [Nocardia sp. CY41]|nr:hypothetical protein [Nocardia sp. CY41]